MMMSLALPDRRLLRVDLYPRVTEISISDKFVNRIQKSVCVPFPDFITSANLELMLLASFLLFLTGAILTVGRLVGDWSFGDGVLELIILKSSFRSFEESANVWTHSCRAYLRALTWRTIAALKSTRRAAG